MFKKIASILAITAGLATVSIAGVNANDTASWQKAVIKKVMKKQTYPRSAISREIEGRAKVKISVDASGAILSHEVVEATGQSILDREIPKLMKKLDPLPALPEGQTAKTFVLPLNWSLD